MLHILLLLCLRSVLSPPIFLLRQMIYSNLNVRAHVPKYSRISASHSHFQEIYLGSSDTSLIHLTIASYVRIPDFQRPTNASLFLQIPACTCPFQSPTCAPQFFPQSLWDLSLIRLYTPVNNRKPPFRQMISKPVDKTRFVRYS